ncbi:hypothetical protein [Paracoccus sp. 22332]|uniref:hypothetical protein n=1 Tax=Paracoccus sp. 22332 TaxID=3453913 RepID=UPI003F85AE53
MSNLPDVEQHSRRWRRLFLAPHLAAQTELALFSIGHASFTMKAVVACVARFATEVFSSYADTQPLDRGGIGLRTEKS